MPESRHKYLYERLGAEDFQQLVGALLTHRFTDFVPMPLGQADGGRDGIRDHVDGQVLIYQVKWSSTGHEKHSLSWLDEAIRHEEANIRRLVAEGAKKYVLVTNVPSTGSPGTGTYDKLRFKLKAYAKDFGIEDMSCIWREGMNAILDGAPTEIKWSYADMLAGWDLIIYLIRSRGVGRESGLHNIIRKVATTQWGDDERIKFGQADVDRELVADLFVDVTADRVQAPASGAQRSGVSAFGKDADIGGAAKYLLKTNGGLTLVRGAPGQGKSTLSQYISQAHRAAFIPEVSKSSNQEKASQPRFPLRLDLADYAAWLSGIDVFDPTEDRSPKKGKRRAAASATIECFLADLVRHASGGSPQVDADFIDELFARVPSLVVLDGLDEVGRLSTRTFVVRAIDQFCRRIASYRVPPQVIVTTRPNAGELPEPTLDQFEVLSLTPMDRNLRDEYLNRWCSVHGIHGRDGRSLRRSFREKSKEPYIGELAGNPMQLTILLDLLHQQGEATPTQRTALYDSYMSLLLAREANKHPESVRKHRADLLEIIPFLGWYIQSRGEEDGLADRMTVKQIGAAMRHFQSTYGKPESAVDELLEAAIDRLWALTSKEEGTYEFDVVSLREYFAARFLYRYAGEGDRAFDRTTVLRELLRRSFWLNTARFYGGNAVGSDIYALAAGIRDEIRENPAGQVCAAAWTLLTDGVFFSRPREAEDLIEVLCSDEIAPMLLDALLNKSSIVRLPQVPDTGGENKTWKRLTEAIAATPEDPLNPGRVSVIRNLLNLKPAFARWLESQLADALPAGNAIPWLELAAEDEALAGLSADLDGIDLSGPAAQLVLNSGLLPAAGGNLEADLLDAVLDGRCPEVRSTRTLPAQVAWALRPSLFYTTSNSAFSSDDEEGHLRENAMASLRRAGSEYATVASLRKFRSGERGSTFPWANTASALFAEAGRCWLATEIAVIGAAHPHRDGASKKPGSAAFGPNGHPATLLVESRAHSRNTSWWREQLSTAVDELGHAEWAIAVWAVASGPVIDDLLGTWERVLADLSHQRREPMWLAAQRLGRSGLLIGRDPSVSATSALGEQWVRSRNPTTAEPSRASSPLTSASEPAPVPLVKVARAAKWLRVDDEPTYH